MTEFKRGWKTMLDGSRIPMSEDEASNLWNIVEQKQAEQAAAYPTTHSALRAYIDADERMRDLGWRSTIFDLEDGDEVAVAERGSTGIFRAVWVKPYLHYHDCVSNMGKHFVKRVADLTEDEAETMARCEADHLEYMRAQTKTMQTLQSFMERYEA